MNALPLVGRKSYRLTGVMGYFFIRTLDLSDILPNIMRPSGFNIRFLLDTRSNKQAKSIGINVSMLNKCFYPIKHRLYGFILQNKHTYNLLAPVYVYTVGGAAKLCLLHFYILFILHYIYIILFIFYIFIFLIV